MRTITKWMSGSAMVGLGLVLLQGALVTQSESGRGCGDDWPLCHGRFVPEYTIASIIEYSHRILSGLALLLVLAMVFFVLRTIPSWRIRTLALSTLFLVLLQAILGAMQVVQPQTHAILALHFGFALLAFTLSWIVYREVGAYEQHVQEQRSMVRVPAGVRWYVIGTTMYAYFVVYTGAYTSHTGAASGCSRVWTCPEYRFGVFDLAATVLGHRFAAYGLVVLAVILFVLIWRTSWEQRALRQLAWGTLAVVGAQLASGALNVWMLGSDYYLLATLLHTVLVALLFALLSIFSLEMWKRRG